VSTATDVSVRLLQQMITGVQAATDMSSPSFGTPERTSTRRVKTELDFDKSVIRRLTREV
jgi:hypothetical protein